VSVDQTALVSYRVDYLDVVVDLSVSAALAVNPDAQPPVVRATASVTMAVSAVLVFLLLRDVDAVPTVSAVTRVSGRTHADYLAAPVALTVLAPRVVNLDVSSLAVKITVNARTAVNVALEYLLQRNVHVDQTVSVATPASGSISVDYLAAPVALTVLAPRVVNLGVSSLAVEITVNVRTAVNVALEYLLQRNVHVDQIVSVATTVKQLVDWLAVLVVTRAAVPRAVSLAVSLTAVRTTVCV